MSSSVVWQKEEPEVSPLPKQDITGLQAPDICVNAVFSAVSNSLQSKRLISEQCGVCQKHHLDLITPKNEPPTCQM